MRKNMRKPTSWIGWAIAVSLGICPVVNAAPSKTGAKDKTEIKSDEPSSRPVPFHGRVVSVDHSAKTFTLNGKGRERLFRTTEHTEFWKEGKQADFKAIVPGENVRGSAIKIEAEWEVKKVTIGNKEDPEPEKRK
jgi:hypothetical protein